MHQSNNDQIQRVSVKCPPVWAEKPSFGLLKLIPKFTIPRIANKETFHKVASHLDTRYAAEV